MSSKSDLLKNDRERKLYYAYKHMGDKDFYYELRDNLISVIRRYHSNIYFGCEDSGHRHYHEQLVFRHIG